MAETIIQIMCRNLVMQGTPGSAVVEILGAHHRFAKSLEPSNLRDGAMASNPDMSLECFQFPAVSGGWKCVPKASLGREPQPQAESDDRDRADPAEPKRGKPQQALLERPRSLFIRHQ
jgi:hypothetical protein